MLSILFIFIPFLYLVFKRNELINNKTQFYFLSLLLCGIFGFIDFKLFFGDGTISFYNGSNLVNNITNTNNTIHNITNTPTISHITNNNTINIHNITTPPITNTPTTTPPITTPPTTTPPTIPPTTTPPITTPPITTPPITTPPITTPPSKIIYSVNNPKKIKNLIYEDKEFYSTFQNYYSPKQDKPVYVYTHKRNDSKNFIDFSDWYINREVNNMGIISFTRVENINQVPKGSILIIVLTPNSDGYYLDILNLIGYNNFNYQNSNELPLFSRVHFLGPEAHFSQFHIDLDYFLPKHKQYRIVDHPMIRFKYHIIKFVTLASINQQSLMSSTLKQLEQLQYPINADTIDCSSTRQLTSELQDWGMYSSFHINIYRLLLAIYSNRMYILQQGGFQYGSFNHLFLPVSICDLYSYDPYRLSQFQIHTVHYPNSNGQNIQFSSRSTHYNQNTGNYLPDQLKENFINGFQAQSFLVQYLASPTYAMREFVNDAIAQVFHKTTYQPRCISFHIRHGDKGVESDIFTFEQYIDALKTLIETKPTLITRDADGNFNIQDIFVMTDDQYIIERFYNWDAIINGIKFNIHSMDINRPNTKSQGYEMKAHQKFDTNLPKEYFGMSMHAESVIASRCEVFIGTLSSNIGRLIVELQSSNENLNNFDYTYVSLDMPYPHDMGSIPQTKFPS